MSHTNDSNNKKALDETLEKLVSITIARKPFATIKNDPSHSKKENNEKAFKHSNKFKKTEPKKQKQGGFVIGGHDGAELNLMNTQGGLNALRIFTQIGELKPIYLNQAFFDSI